MAVIYSPLYHRPDFSLHTSEAAIETSDELLEYGRFERAEVLDGAVAFNLKNPLNLDPALNRALFLGMVGLTVAEGANLTHNSSHRHRMGEERTMLLALLNSLSMAQAVDMAFRKRALTINRPIKTVRALSALQQEILAGQAEGRLQVDIAQDAGITFNRLAKDAALMYGQLSVTGAAAAVLVGRMAKIL